MILNFHYPISIEAAQMIRKSAEYTKNKCGKTEFIFVGFRFSSHMFRYYYGEKLTEIHLDESLEYIIFSSLSSFVEEEYAYENNDDIQREQFMLFSDQSLLGYIEKHKISS